MLMCISSQVLFFRHTIDELEKLLGNCHAAADAAREATRGGSKAPTAGVPACEPTQSTNDSAEAPVSNSEPTQSAADSAVAPVAPVSDSEPTIARQPARTGVCLCTGMCVCAQATCSVVVRCVYWIIEATSEHSLL